MRHILTSVVLAVLLFPSLGLSEKLYDLVGREGVFYKRFTDVPFTGKVTGLSQGKLKNGKKVGPWVEYHVNRQLSSKGTFKNGKPEGPRVEFWSNGQLLSKGTWKNGKKEGPWVFYHEDGTVWESYTGTYKDGKKVK
jgi:antitoxin component YwqK of YwqJK toxin-antitoxin module